jgi:hypothetical protein
LFVEQNVSLQEQVPGDLAETLLGGKTLVRLLFLILQHLSLGRRLTSVVKEREFSAHASQEKGRFARTAKQAESVK